MTARAAILARASGPRGHVQGGAVEASGPVYDARDGVVQVYVRGPAPGKPRQTRSDKWKQRPCVMQYREWADRVRLACPKPPPADAVRDVEIFAYYSPPPSWSKAKRAAVIGTPKRTAPDWDNIGKAVCDALWSDDAGLWRGKVEKWWAEEDRTLILIHLERELVDARKAG